MGGSAAKQRRRQQRLEKQKNEEAVTKDSASPSMPKRENASSNKKPNFKKSATHNAKQTKQPGKKFGGKPKDESNKKKFKKPKHLKRKLEQIEEASDDTEKQNVLRELERFEIQKKAHIIQGKQLVQKRKLFKKQRTEKNDVDEKQEAAVKKEENVSVEDQQSPTQEMQVESLHIVKEEMAIEENTMNSVASNDEAASVEDEKSKPVDSDSDDDSVAAPVEPKRQRGKRRRGRKDTSLKPTQQQSASVEKDLVAADLTTNSIKESDDDVPETEEKGGLGKDESQDDKDSASLKTKKTTEKDSSRYCVGRKPVTDFEVGKTYAGKVVYTKPFGIFVDIGCHSDAFIHVSRLRDEYVSSPEELFKEDDEVPNVRILEVDRKHKRITGSLQTLAMAEYEQKSIDARKHRREKIKSKSNSKSDAPKKKSGGSSKGKIQIGVSKPSVTQQHHHHESSTDTSQPAQYNSNSSNLLEKPESEMTPAELKRARKLARRAARRAAQEGTAQEQAQ